ncbi:MAG: hypothetical protein UT13_C0001G0251 [Candidatus Pacebacteria bacterium GW2011_GWF2_38_9]|nr:MAG: hypothetical protein US01_C0001G0254 [candidate division TM6 bacterium GW2011_GWF2_28_16]KKQ88604.1 MAG: hypothetical protein UT13_C0001G0251 [Candidatus Pacebacteria bacterium GW2011_GWF2_38_9]HAZ73488.1 hypothetical protein [Candidatus Paceibacterota bacterium]
MKKKFPLFLLLIIIAGAAVYFFSQKNNPQLAEKAAEKAVVNEMLANCKYDKDVCAYFVAQAQAMEKGVVISTVANLGEYGTSTSEMKTSGSDMEVNSYKDGQLESSMISFGGVTYFEDLEDNSWYQVGDAEGNFSDPKESLVEIQATYNEDNLDMQIKKVGSEACGNLTCDKYEIIDTMGEDGSTSYVWIDTKEHLARRMEFSFEGGSNVMEYKYEAVQINKPAPIKEMPMFDAPDSSEVESGEMPSQAELEQMMKDYGLDGE